WRPPALVVARPVTASCPRGCPLPGPQNSPIPARVGLSAAAAFLVLLVVWAAQRAVAPTTAFHDPSVAVPARSSSAPSASPTPTPLRSPPASSPSRVTSQPSARRQSPSRALVASSAATSLTVTVSVPASWEQGYVTSVRVRNTGTKAVTWIVTVTHSNQQDL